MRYGIFGGSFNPPHSGHRRLLDELTRYLDLDGVFVIPANVSPFKTGNKGASNIDRLNMCRLAFESDKYTVSDIELNRKGKSYTSDTLDILKKRYPDDDFYLFMGSDMLLSFDRWYNYKHILDCATVCAVSRSDDDGVDKLEKYVRDVLDGNKNVMIIPVSPFVISSSEIRDNIKNSREFTSFIDEKVADYIKDRGLYID